MKKIVVILGPTAIGKTSFAIKKAKDYNTEIISFDSRQFYKEMNIGTAVPSQEELNEVKHHFIQNLSIKTKYSIGDYRKQATELINELFKKKDVIVMVGGSGMYLDAVLYGLDEFPDIPTYIRKNLLKDYNEKGIEYLQEMLLKKDMDYYNKVDINNHHRLIRALEICIYTEEPYSSFLKNEKKLKIDCQLEKIVLTAPRQIIYERINQRVDLMIKEGLLEEVKKLYEYKNFNALQTVGYKEIFSFLDKEIELDKAIELIKQNTRRYAKRQLTWINNKCENIIFYEILGK